MGVKSSKSFHAHVHVHDFISLEEPGVEASFSSARLPVSWIFSWPLCVLMAEMITSIPPRDAIFTWFTGDRGNKKSIWALPLQMMTLLLLWSKKRNHAHLLSNVFIPSPSAPTHKFATFASDIMMFDVSLGFSFISWMRDAARDVSTVGKGSEQRRKDTTFRDSDQINWISWRNEIIYIKRAYKHLRNDHVYE